LKGHFASEEEFQDLLTKRILEHKQNEILEMEKAQK